jgi:peptidoglycan/LPS O-acetylase OafA/YrhL
MSTHPDHDHAGQELDTRTSARKEPKHFAYIDAVRGIAFLGVLMLHSASCVGEFPKSSLVKCGGYGVQLFFLASAITLCFSMGARSKVDRYPVISFYVRRLFRIAPLFWLAMIFYWVFPGIMPAFWLGQWAPYGVHKSYFLLTALFLHGWTPYTFNSIVPGGWSIAVEMTFYIIFPLCFFFINSLKRAAVVVLCSIIFAKGEGHVMSYLHSHYYRDIDPTVFTFFSNLWFPSEIGVFMIGIFAYHLIRLPAANTFSKSSFWANTLLILGLIAFPGFCLDGGSSGIPSSLLISATMAALIFSISAGAVPLIINRVICYIGKISYSCYLVHFAALGCTLKILGITETAQHRNYDTGHPLTNFILFATIFSIGLILTIPIATLTLHLIENPGIELGRRILKRVNSSPRHPSVHK